MISISVFHLVINIHLINSSLISPNRQINLIGLVNRDQALDRLNYLKLSVGKVLL